MHYCIEPYLNTDVQFRDMRQLLIDSYKYLHWPVNWLTARIEDWRYGGNAMELQDNPDYLNDKAWLWRTESGELAGFVLSETGDNIWVQVHPDHADLARLALHWVNDNWHPESAKLYTFTDSKDQYRSTILEDLGFRDLGEDSFLRGYELLSRNEFASIPDGFSLANLNECPLEYELVTTVNETFNHRLPLKWLDSLLAAPSMEPSRIWFLRTNDDFVASFCFAWIDELNHIAELEPVGTHPEFRQRGLAKALVQTVFDQLKYRGVEQVYISSSTEKRATAFYDQLKPDSRWLTRRWVKDVHAL